MSILILLFIENQPAHMMSLTLNQRAPKARVVRMGGGLVSGDQNCPSILNLRHLRSKMHWWRKWSSKLPAGIR